MNDCGIDGVSEKDSGKCKNNSEIDMGPFSFMESGIDYNVTDNMAKDTNHSIYNNALIDMSFFSADQLYGSYVKDGNTYQSRLQPCVEGSCENLSRGDRDFTIRNPESTRNIYGNYAIGGNINLCTDINGDGKCIGDEKTTSNKHPSIYVDIDDDDSTVNSSSFELDIAANSEVLWAGLYWQGTIHNSNNDDDANDEDFGRDGLWVSGNKVVGATNVDNSHKQIDLLAYNNGHGAYDACKVKFKTPNGSYIDIAADQLDFYQLGYGAFADVTDLINKTSPNGVYTVADIKSQINKEKTHGNYAAWSLVVIYKNTNETYKNITLFDGFVTVNKSYAGDLVMDGFLTSKTPPVRSKLAFFTMDGDNGSNSLEIVNQSGDSTIITDPDYPSDSLFNSSIEAGINRTPNVPSARMDLDIIDLEDVLGTSDSTATLKPRSGGDRYTASYFIMSANLRGVDMCYDYTYGQNGNYTSDSNISSPRIEDTFTSDLIDVKLYFENQENSDVTIKNLTVSIDPINSGTSYELGTTKVAKPNQAIEDVADTNASAGYNNDIEIGDVGSLEHFYTYYSLEHDNNDVNASINAYVKYDLVVTIDGQDIELDNQTTQISAMNPCQSTSAYTPVKGRFNVVHDSMLNNSLSSGYYYNLPTQIVNRAGDYKIQSLDFDNLNNKKAVATIVAVEMINVEGFHYSTATCTDKDTEVISTKRIWNIFDNNATSFTVDLDKAKMLDAGFFSKALQNAAFRISFNMLNNTNETLVSIEKDGNDYKILNYTDLVQGIGSCKQAVEDPTNSNQTTTDVNVACGNNGDSISAHHLEICNECLYGYTTKILCSRDNFAIRPEAFSISLEDNSSTPSLPIISQPDNISADLAADYDYKLRVTATTHTSSGASNGYTRTFVSADEGAKYLWNSSKTLTQCNDTDDNSTSVTFSNGISSDISKLIQVGKYKLNVTDKTWTKVDNDPVYYGIHHSTPSISSEEASYFDQSDNSDCVHDNSETPISGSLAGCEISSEHTNATLQYHDANITFHPYTFDITKDIKMGPNNSSNFVYMADIDSDTNMSVHINTTITAVGKNSTTPLSNFVTGCYAKPINLSIYKSAAKNTALQYKYKLYDYDSSVSTLSHTDPDNDDEKTISYDANISINLGDTSSNTTDFFQKDMQGSIVIKTNMNFDRATNVVSNPEKIHFDKISVKDSANSLIADGLTGYTASGDKNISEDIAHYYGRTHAGRQRFEAASGATTASGVANIYYEIYCFGNTNGKECDTTLLPSTKHTNDIRWFINTNHNQSNDGDLTSTAVDEQNSLTYVDEDISARDTTTAHISKVKLNYNGDQGYPYRTTVENNASKWLIYNEDNPSANTNSFPVEFDKESTGWSGEHETTTTTKSFKNIKTNRRSMW
jgi:hypothetical protein